MEKMNKKGQFLARDWVMSIILFAGIIALAVLSVSSLAVEYNNEDIINEDIEDNYAKVSETTALATAAFDAANEKEGLSFAGSVDVLFTSAFTVIALVFNSIGIATGQMLSFGEDFGIPTAVSAIFFGVITAILMVILVFVIISTTTQRRF